MLQVSWPQGTDEQEPTSAGLGQQGRLHKSAGVVMERVCGGGACGVELWHRLASSRAASRASKHVLSSLPGTSLVMMDCISVESSVFR